jgi:NAD(P)H-dependent FMN reductase
MKTLILDGSHVGDPMGARFSAALQIHCPEAEAIVLREQKIGNCAGDFFCWVRSPGLCNTDDDNRVIAAKVMQSELLVYLTPVTFGGYSSALKRMGSPVDILPFLPPPLAKSIASVTRAIQTFWSLAGRTRPTRAEAIFRHLVQPMPSAPTPNRLFLD